MNVEAFYNALQSEGVCYFTGVPDSFLKDFCFYITDHDEKCTHIVAANEGNAVALAAGFYLGSGKPVMVYMQNSGLGNAVNPLLSLVDREVYSIPMLILIGWRGEPGIKDEPQHKKQGKVTESLLEAMEIPFIMINSMSDPLDVVGKSIRKMKKLMSPVALLASRGTFDEYEKKGYAPNRDLSLSREEAIKCIAKCIDSSSAIISTTGMISRELYEYRAEMKDSHDRDFLTVGSMGHASSIAMGIARCTPDRKVICLDGDGSVLMHMGALAILGQSNLKNLVHVVINNGVHDSVGGQPTVGFAVDFVNIARSCGYRVIETVSTMNNLCTSIGKQTRMNGPNFLEVKVRPGHRSNLIRPGGDPVENRTEFMNHLFSGKKT